MDRMCPLSRMEMNKPLRLPQTQQGGSEETRAVSRNSAARPITGRDVRHGSDSKESSFTGREMEEVEERG
ncbi:hypothetical protein EYF80_027202 [Liparis tanakae]|uniref:Uncharacterized protein n=1 Tax=Liparis tanakae TaxID=230148 RepID=A0A4Z2HC60_9TELE|nr:hypothetical protein EYF80_027202 [Liparis tanakae]